MRSPAENEKKRVVVALSGGVDSSVAAALLCRQGYQVTGVTMKIWDGHTSPGVRRRGCCSPDEEENINDARAVANKLQIPYLVVDLTNEFTNEILYYVKQEYLRGRTPNPCSRCNLKMKFGALIRKVAGQGLQYDYFATGHYARIEYDKYCNRYLLKKARDENKDQSYFLALLPREEMSSVLFPLGKLLKTEVRSLARDFGLDVSRKTDSQDFFAGGYDLLLNRSTPGSIINKNGVEIGRHKGIGLHTIGQRKGLGIAGAKPLYVTKIDPVRNVVIVGERDEIYKDNFIASQLNWIGIEELAHPRKIMAKIRYRHEESEALVTPIAASSVHVKFDKPQMAVTPGQTVVFYSNDIVVGGGVIDTVGDDQR